VDVASPEARILKLVSFILAQPGAVTAGQIFERFPDDYGKAATPTAKDAREKKFSRDKAAIKRLGFVLAKASEESYLIDPRSSELPAIQLDPDEALAVWTAAVAALRHSDHPLREDLENALRKMISGWRGMPPRAGQESDVGADGGSLERISRLRRAIPEVLQEEATALSRGLDVAIAPPEPWAGVLGEAISRRLETVIEYRAVADDTVAPRSVEPRLLFQRDGQWYLAAWNVARAEEHLYRLDRIASVVPGTRVFDQHKGPATARYSRNLFFESGRERDVAIRYAGVAARHARRRDGARLHEEQGGAVTVTSRANPGNYLFGVVLGAGGEAAVAGPADVVAAFEARLAELEGLYG
jgi:predicted DNA-binding transcriptional regulator YafY